MMEKNGAIGPSTPSAGTRHCGEKQAESAIDTLDDDVTRRAAQAARSALTGGNVNEQPVAKDS
jgi:hypothetical protein